MSGMFDHSAEEAVVSDKSLNVAQSAKKAVSLSYQLSISRPNVRTKIRPAQTQQKKIWESFLPLKKSNEVKIGGH